MYEARIRLWNKDPKKLTKLLEWFDQMMKTLQKDDERPVRGTTYEALLPRKEKYWA